MKLEGRTILITGGSGGIGFELARLLAPRNTVIVTGRNADKLKGAQSQIPSLHTLRSDASDATAIENLASEVTARFPKLDILINNAGIMRVVNLRAPNDAGYLVQEIETNLLGAISMVQRFLPHLEMQPEAAIVNVTSGLAFVPLPACPIYSAAKAGLHAYTQALRVQLRPTRVKVFELAPPGTKTNLDRDFPKGIADPGMYMDVSKLANATLRGLERNTAEIRPGLSSVLHTVHRLAPGLTLTSKGAEAVVARVGANGVLP
jgi:uncharacterized oxidoreductase